MNELDEIPEAELHPRRRTWLHLIPLAAALLALSLFYLVWHQSGILVTLTFQQGHGLKAGDTLRYRGIDIGQVREVRLNPQLQGIIVKLHVLPSAQNLLREGSQFWIVRPQVDLSGASGLDTVIGANYLRVLPGEGAVQRQFVGLENPPYLELMPKGGVTLLLRTPGQGSLRAGAPVVYRQVVIGKLIQVGLSKDAGAVEAQAYIEPDYVNLARNNAVFWKINAARLDAGWLSGISLQIESVQSLVTGGVGMALPPQPGERAKDGQLFELQEEVRDIWLQWQPHLQTQDSRQTAAQRPLPVRGYLSWRNEGWLNVLKDTQRTAWLLPIEGGLLGPEALFALPASAKPGSVHLRIGDLNLGLQATVAQPVAEGVALLPYPYAAPLWNMQNQRLAQQPEDVQIYTGAGQAPYFVTADRLQADHSGGWQIKDATLAETYWQGAPAVAASDGKLLGLLLLDDKSARIRLLPKLDSIAQP